MANPLGFVLPAAAIGLGSIMVSPKRGFVLAPGAKPFTAQATVEEQHHDELEITEHPVEQGAPIADHAYKRPSEVQIRMAWGAALPPSPGGLVGAALGAASAINSIVAAAAAALPTLQAIQSILSGNNPGQPADIYKKLLALQIIRAPFTLLTGKRSYTNMLLKSISVETDNTTENMLMVVCRCRQVILVATTTSAISSDSAVMTNPEATAPVTPEGPQSLLDAPKLVPDLGSLSGAVTNLQGGLAGATSLLSQLPGGITSLTGAVSGVIGTLPNILSQATAALSSATSGLAGAIALPSFEIPSFPNASEISVALSPATISDAMKELPATLTTAQNQLAQMIVEMPTIAAQLPATLTNLSPALLEVQVGISTVIRNVGEAIQRAPVGLP